MVDDELTTPPHIDEGTLHAWLDGALSPDEVTAVESHVANCAQCSERAAEARGLIAASTRILSALDDVPGNVIPTAKAAGVAPTRSSRTGRSARIYGPIAAVALFAVGAMLFLRRTPTLVPTSAAPQEIVTVPAGRTVENGHTAAPSPSPSAPTIMAKPTIQAAPSARASAETRKRRVAAVTTTATGEAAQESQSSALRFDATKPEAAATAAQATRAVGVLAADAASPKAASLLAGVTAQSFRADAFATASPTMTGARVVSSSEYNSDNTRVRRTVFALDSVTTVTFTERRVLPAEEARVALKADTTVRAGLLSLRWPSLQDGQSVTWIAPDGTVFTLSGSLSVKELEALKSRIVP